MVVCCHCGSKNVVAGHQSIGYRSICESCIEKKQPLIKGSMKSNPKRVIKNLKKMSQKKRKVNAKKSRRDKNRVKIKQEKKRIELDEEESCTESHSSNSCNMTRSIKVKKEKINAAMDDEDEYSPSDSSKICNPSIFSWSHIAISLPF